MFIILLTAAYAGAFSVKVLNYSPPKAVTIEGNKPLIIVDEKNAVVVSNGVKKIIKTDGQEIELEEINTKCYRIKK